jgi:ABC-type multidrug transport system ATPase subunit
MISETSQTDGRDDVLLVETSGLTKRYGGRITAVDDLDLGVRRGEVYGFLGPNGAGKTTTLRMLLGLIKSSFGTATVLDWSPTCSRTSPAPGVRWPSSSVRSS